MDREVLQFLHEYAAEGKTVIVISHSTEHLGLARRVLVLAKGGRPVYYGPSGAQLLGALGADSYATLMKRLNADPKPFADAYQTSPHVEEARAEAGKLASSAAKSGRKTGRPRKLKAWLRQLRVLTARQTALLLTSGAASLTGKLSPLKFVRGASTVLAPLLIAAIGATLAGFVGGSDGLGAIHDPKLSTASGTLSLLVTLSMLCGQALTYSDIVKDYPTIHREHRTGVFTMPVLVSKWAVFAFVAAIQATLITTIFLAIRPAPVYGEAFGPVTALYVNMIAMTIAAMTLGLLISAAMSKLEQAIAVTTAVSIAQIALNGVASNLSASHLTNHVTNYLSMLFPARWGLAATASSVNLRVISAAANPDALWHHSIGQWALDVTMLGAVTLANFLLARILLGRRLRKSD